MTQGCCLLPLLHEIFASAKTELSLAGDAKWIGTKIPMEVTMALGGPCEVGRTVTGVEMYVFVPMHFFLHIR